MIVRDNLTGHRFIGDKHTDIVVQLHKASHAKFRDLDLYMKNVVDWVSKSAMGELSLKGDTIEDRCASFLSSSIEIGLLSLCEPRK